MNGSGRIKSAAEQRVDSLHVARGLAALLVAVGHAYWLPFDTELQTLFFGVPLDQSHPEWLDGAPPLYRLLSTGNLPVAVFFLLSGYVLEGALRKLKPLGFSINRIFRIFPVFWVCLALHLAVIALFTGHIAGRRELLGAALLVTSQAVFPVSWTLTYEVRYYAVAAAMSLARIPPIARAIILLAAFAAFGSTTLYWLSFMSLGALSFHASSAIRVYEGGRIPLAVLLAVIGSFVWFFVATNVHPIQFPLQEMVGGALVFVIAIAIPTIRIRERALNFLGDISYSLYCVHMPVVACTYFFLSGWAPLLLVAPVAICLSLLAGTLVHATVEEPGRKLGSAVSAWLKRSRIAPLIPTASEPPVPP